MSNFVYITLDTTAPSNPTITIEGGAVFVTNQLVNISLSVDDADKTGYQMKIWGDVDTTYDTNIQDTETNSKWIPYSENPQVKLATGDGSKTINLRVRDDVNNASSVAVDNVSLDTTLPTVTVTNPDVSKISLISGKDASSFTFTVSEDFSDYSVRLVGSTSSTHDAGMEIPTAGGSVNTSGIGSFTKSDVTTVTIKGADLVSAGATSDGQKIIKVFVKDMSGQWSA